MDMMDDETEGSGSPAKQVPCLASWSYVVPGFGGEQTKANNFFMPVP
jgi:hypothetical protein